MYFSEKAMHKVLEIGKTLSFSPTLLDVGCGDCKHAAPFCNAGFKVTGLDIAKPKFEHKNFTYHQTFFTQYKPDIGEQYDFVWASHILEHIPEPQYFLIHVRQFLKPGGSLIITCPPLKHQIVGGHINLFNPGIIMYRAVLAGFDCRNAKIKQYGYNMTVIIPNSFANFSHNDLKYDNGDIETISKFLPKGYNYQGFNGDIKELNWD